MRITVDDLQRPEKVEPFELELDNETVIAFPDPRSLHFTKLLELTDAPPTEQIRIIVGEDFDRLAALPNADGYFFESLMTAYSRHYGAALGALAATSGGR
ncbi:MAG TPA: hypothetical protein VFH50_02325 [Acidimicrobiales bacterium]|nr:hypothetical protein [Acidimicrobiales bacterium]